MQLASCLASAFPFSGIRSTHRQSSNALTQILRTLFAHRSKTGHNPNLIYCGRALFEAVVLDLPPVLCGTVVCLSERLDGYDCEAQDFTTEEVEAFEEVAL